jgi:hypothetical protein
MAGNDWTALTSGLSDSQVRRGATDGITPPNGGGTFTYGMRSVAAVTGAVGLKVNLTDFDPLAAGGRVSVAMQKASGSGALNYNPMIYIGLQGSAVSNVGYLLGFAADENPAHLILMKGAPSAGIKTTSDYILRTSNNTYASGTFYHFLLDMIVQPSGDVLLIVKENTDLATNPVTAPDWTAISGMTDFKDDVLGHNSGSAPYVTGRCGIAGYIGGDSGRAMFFDHFVCGKQV